MNKELKNKKRMKKNKSKTDSIKTSNSTVNNMAEDIISDVCKEFDKMSPEAKRKFKQQTLENLRKSIKDMVESDSKKSPIEKFDLTNKYPINNQSNTSDQESYINDLIKQKPLNEQEIDLLKCRVSEYLKSFAIFGYDLKGNRILITNCKTVQDGDSIFQMSQHIPSILFQIFNGYESGNINNMF
jgi:sugar-specific transcriptional regulator TrmB